MTFLMKLLSSKMPDGAVDNIIFKLELMPSIRGTNLNTLWSDLCNRDMDNIRSIISNCPTDVLEHACAQQDYSGRETTKEYLVNPLN